MGKGNQGGLRKEVRKDKVMAAREDEARQPAEWKKGSQGGWRKEVRKMGKEKKEEPTKCREWSDKENERGREAETCAFCIVS